VVKNISIVNAKVVRKRRREILEVASNAVDKLKPYF
jgi:hypothetical protein